MIKSLIKLWIALFTLTGSLAAVAPSTLAGSPAKVARVGLFDGGAPTPPRRLVWKKFSKRMHALGYVEGKDITYELRWAHGKADRLRDVARELARLKVDAIVVRAGTAAVAAKRATSTIPIVMAVVSNAIRSGLIESYARPGGNVTGVVVQVNEATMKRLELLKEIVPSASRVAILGAKTHPNFRPAVRMTKAAARTLGVSLLEVGITGADELDSAFSTMARARIDALVVVPGANMGSAADRLARLATKGRIPAAFAGPEYVQAGGLIHYGGDADHLFHRAAYFLHRILKDAHPSELPAERQSKFSLIVNLKTAKALGITFPHSVLLRATEVIE